MARHIGTLTPSIEHRLSAWERIQEHVAKAPAPRLRPTITLSREFGCEAFVLADLLKQRFETLTGEPWNVYDKTLLEAVAQEQGIELATLSRLGETARSLEKLGMRPPEYHQHAEAFRAVAERLVQFATVGNAIVIGRGGAVLTQKLANCFHLRLEASLAWRTESIARRLEMAPDEARHFVEAHSSAREQFMREQLKVDPHERSFFDLTFNAAKASNEAMAAAAVAYVRAKWTDPSWPKD